MRLSKSRVNLFLECPKKYYYEHTLGLKKYIDEPELGTPLRIGVDVHELFEWYYLQPEAREIKEPYRESMQTIFDKNPMSELYQHYISNFIEFNLVMIEQFGVPGYMPEAVELELFEPKLNLIGIIDVVFYQDGVRTIIDYKTGKTPKGIREYRLELVMYKIIYEQVTGNKVDCVGVYFPYRNQFRMMNVVGPLDEEPEKGPFITLEDELEAIAQIDNIRERIEAHEFETHKGFHCNYCPYIARCNEENAYNV
jgi:CRISPR/Cas system-associated exonuclease Cas4 (RecB family)